MFEFITMIFAVIGFVTIALCAVSLVVGFICDTFCFCDE